VKELNEQIEAVIDVKCAALYLNLLNTYQEQALKEKQESGEGK